MHSTSQCVSLTHFLRPLSLYTFVKLTLVRSSAAGVLISSILQAGSRRLSQQSSDASQPATAWARLRWSGNIWSTPAVLPCRQRPPIETAPSLPKHGLAHKTQTRNAWNRHCEMPGGSLQAN